MPELNKITVDPKGTTLAVTITGHGSVTAYTTSAGTTPVSFPDEITTAKDYWLAESFDYTVVGTINDVEVVRETVGVADAEGAPTPVVRVDPTPGALIAAASAGGGSGASGAANSFLSVSLGSDIIRATNPRTMFAGTPHIVGTDLEWDADTGKAKALTAGLYTPVYDWYVQPSVDADGVLYSALGYTIAGDSFYAIFNNSQETLIRAGGYDGASWFPTVVLPPVWLDIDDEAGPGNDNWDVFLTAGTVKFKSGSHFALIKTA